MLVFSSTDEHLKEWPKSNIKRFVSKFMKTFRTILQCYLIQINIFGQFIAIIGVRNKMTFSFWAKPCYCGHANCPPSSDNLLKVALLLLWLVLCFLLAIEWIYFSLIYSNLFPHVRSRRVNNKILIFMETFSDSFNHFYVFHSLLN